MAGRRPLLKQLGELTAADFAKHPLWVEVHHQDQDQPWYESTDEATVRPWDGPVPTPLPRGRLHARATITLQDGREFAGYAAAERSPGAKNAGRRQMGSIQPGLFGKYRNSRAHTFWGGKVGIDEDARRAFFAAVESESPFPMRFAIEPGLIRGLGASVFASGFIDGFYRLLDKSEVRVEAGVKPEPIRQKRPSKTETLKEELSRVADLVRSNQRKEALAHAQRLVNLHARNGDCWEELAYAWAANRNYPLSIEASENAIACNKRDPYRYKDACWLATRTKQWSAALSFAERGRSLKIQWQVRMMFTDEFGAYGARALYELGRYAEALKWLEPVTPVHVALTFPDDPLSKVRALVKACRAGLKARK